MSHNNVPYSMFADIISNTNLVNPEVNRDRRSRIPQPGTIARVCPRKGLDAPVWKHDAELFDRWSGLAPEGDTVLVIANNELGKPGAGWWVRVIWQGREWMMDGTQLREVDDE